MSCASCGSADFDGDGDLDIAAISYFPDYAKHPDEGFVYLRNDGDWHFQPFVLREARQGRWLVMDAGDIDGDGVMVTGSKSNVNPTLYGGEAGEKNGPYDDARDSTTLPLIRKAIERGVPLLAICRGIQELNVALGGTLATEIQEIEGRMDHRAPQSDRQEERFAIRHPVRIREGSCLAGIFGPGEIMVNSVHRQGIGELAPRLAVEAVADRQLRQFVNASGRPGAIADRGRQIRSRSLFIFSKIPALN